MTDTRNRVRSHVESNPGVHFNAVSRNLDIATGQTQYHLRRLLRSESLHSEEICGRTHYFPDGYSGREQAAIALLRRETTRELVMLLLDREETTPGTLADEVGIARSTVEWHLSNLIDYDLVEKEYDGRTVFVRPTRPELLRETLVEIDPNLPDRLVDRFSRLVDSFFEQ
jgi:predicted transcriptional regulator